MDRARKKEEEEDEGSVSSREGFPQASPALPLVCFALAPPSLPAAPELPN